MVAPLPPVTFAHPVLPSADCCHWMVPVWPASVMVVFPPVHKVAAVAVAVPPTDPGVIVTVTGVLETEGQLVALTIFQVMITCPLPDLAPAVLVCEDPAL